MKQPAIACRLLEIRKTCLLIRVFLFLVKRKKIEFFTAVRNDRNKRRGKEKEQKNGEQNGHGPHSPEEQTCSPEIESLVASVAKFHVDTFPNQSDLRKYEIVNFTNWLTY